MSRDATWRREAFRAGRTRDGGTEAGRGTVTGPDAASRPTLSLRFDASLDTVEDILAVVQDWAAQAGMARDDGLSLRLVLDELLSNICLHAEAPGGEGTVELRLELLAADGQRDAPGSGQTAGAVNGRPTPGSPPQRALSASCCATPADRLIPWPTSRGP